MAKYQQTASGERGMKIKQDNGRDDSSHTVKQPFGKKLGGDPDNLAHSLTGASAVQSGK